MQVTQSLLKQGVRENITYPKEALERTKEQFAQIQVESVEESQFYAQFRFQEKHVFCGKNVAINP